MPDRLNLRSFVKGSYDLQSMRIMVGNRIVGNYKIKLGQQPGQKEDTMDAEGQKILARIRSSYEKMTDGVKRLIGKTEFVADGVIDNYTEFCLVGEYMELELLEERQFNRLKDLIVDFPIYQKFLSKVDGIGPVMASVIIGEIDIFKFATLSKLWKYCGVAVMQDGLGQSRRKEHLVDREYRAKDGTMNTRKSITFNPFLKTKLLGVLGSSFLKCGVRWVPCTDQQWDQAHEDMRAIKEKKDPETGKKREMKCLLSTTHKYAKIYFDYLWRLVHSEKYKDNPDKSKNKGLRAHRHCMANRYMVKMFLIDMWEEWNKIENRPVRPPWIQEKAGLPPHGAPPVFDPSRVDPVSSLYELSDDEEDVRRKCAEAR